MHAFMNLCVLFLGSSSKNPSLPSVVTEISCKSNEAPHYDAKDDNSNGINSQSCIKNNGMRFLHFNIDLSSL